MNEQILCSTCKKMSQAQQTQLLCTLLCLNTETFLTFWLFFILLTIATKEIAKQILPNGFKIFSYLKNNYFNIEDITKKKTKY